MQERNAQPRYNGLCNRCYRETRDVRVPRLPKQFGDIIEQLADPDKSKEYWKNLAVQLQPTIVGVSDGTVKATAAQSAILKRYSAALMVRSRNRRKTSAVLLE